MLYVGLDVHWKQSTFCVLDGNGRHLRTRAIRGTWDKVLPELAKVKRPFAICFEATSGYGYLHEQLSRIAKRVVVAHPGQLRLIFRSRRGEPSGRCNEAGQASVSEVRCLPSTCPQPMCGPGGG